MTPVKILFFITELSTGGAQTVLSHLLSHLDRRRFEPVVVCLYNDDGAPARQIKQQGILVIGLGMTRKWRIDAVWRLYKVLRRHRPTILHTWMFHANVLGRIIGKLAAVPIIITSRHSIRIGGQWRERLKGWTVGLDDKIIAVCDMARQLEIENARTPADKVIVIHNSIDWRKFANVEPHIGAAVRQTLHIPAAAPLIGAVGRLTPAKGFDILLQSFSEVHRQIPDARLLLVGDGTLRSRLEKLTRQLNLAENVIFTGARNDVPHILKTLDIFILSSLWEGLPNTILEAMAAGVPVIATTVGGVPEVITHQENGWLIPPNNTAALTNAIIYLLRHPAERYRLSTNGQMRVKTAFDAERAAQQTFRLYQTLIDRKYSSRKN